MEKIAYVGGPGIPSLSLGAEMAKQMAVKENPPEPVHVHKYVVPNPHKIRYQNRQGQHVMTVENVGTSLHLGPKIGRNALCPCGSGKKYKHCCIDSDRYATDKILVGVCHECGSYVYDKDEIPEHDRIFECPRCGHPWNVNEIMVKEIN